MQNIRKYLDQAILAFLALSLSLVPIVFNPSLWHAFEIVKVVVFSCLLAVVFIIWLAKIIIEQQVVVPADKKIRYAFGLYLLVRLSAVVLSEHISVAFWGSALRGMGFLLELELWFFVYLVWLYWPAIRTRLVLGSALISGVASFVSIYGIAQVAGFDVFSWQLYLNVQQRATSTIGQPNHLAAFLLLSLPFAIWGMSRTSGLKRIAFSLGLLLESLALVLSLSRAAWLGLLFFGAFFVVRYILKKNSKRLIYISAGLLICLSLLFFGLKGQHAPGRAVTDWNISNRLLSLLDLNQGSFRFELYRAGVQLISARPFLGYGPDTQIFYLYHFYNADWPVYEVVNVTADRFHNIILDFIFESGVLGFLSLLGFLWLVVRQVLWVRQPATDHLLLNLLLASLLGLFVALQFSFWSIVTIVYAVLILGLIAGLGLEHQVVEFKNTTWRYVLGVLLLVSLVVGAQQLSIFEASKNFRNLVLVGAASDYPGFESVALNILTQAPASTVESFYRGQILGLTRGFVEEHKITPQALKPLLDAVVSNDNERGIFWERLNRLMLMTSVLKSRPGAVNQPLFELLNNDFKAFKKVAPGYAILELAWGDLYLAAGQEAEALNHYYLALELYPALDNPLMNDEHRQYVSDEESIVLKKIIKIKLAQNQAKAVRNYSRQGLKMAPMDSFFKSQLKWYDERGANKLNK